MNYLRDANDKRELTRFVNSLAAKTDNYARVELNSAATFTVVIDPKVNALCEPFLSPRSATAKTATYWIDDIEEGSFRINHDLGLTDCVYAYVLHGVQWQ